MAEWFKARKTATAEVRDATPEDEEMIRRREGPERLKFLAISDDEPPGRTT